MVTHDLFLHKAMAWCWCSVPRLIRIDSKNSSILRKCADMIGSWCRNHICCSTMWTVHALLFLLGIVFVSAQCPLESNMTRIGLGLTIGDIPSFPPLPSALDLDFGGCGSSYSAYPALFYTYDPVHRALPTLVSLCNLTNPVAIALDVFHNFTCNGDVCAMYYDLNDCGTGQPKLILSPSLSPSSGCPAFLKQRQAVDRQNLIFLLLMRG
jgi:hypothetical protein